MPSVNISEMVEEMHHLYIIHLAVLTQDEIKLCLTESGVLSHRDFPSISPFGSWSMAVPQVGQAHILQCTRLKSNAPWWSLLI